MYNNNIKTSSKWENISDDGLSTFKNILEINGKTYTLILIKMYDRSMDCEIHEGTDINEDLDSLLETINFEKGFTKNQIRDWIIDYKLRLRVG